ncbi:hypothetical protein AWB75_03699 [Caballeronia catudaia]|uniref:Uncharacterized protein n=1 Tax=Caballeronia catudaia TaxID=1777136 RepID=A0A158BMJ4_9BURK|nr:hypothetical protein [Caballeronia catudaia]SAK71210.1 hypothetical protein AWB75_03699 [Caballeronia catudaia]
MVSLSRSYAPGVGSLILLAHDAFRFLRQREVRETTRQHARNAFLPSRAQRLKSAVIVPESAKVATTSVTAPS